MSSWPMMVIDGWKSVKDLGSVANFIVMSVGTLRESLHSRDLSRPEQSVKELRCYGARAPFWESLSAPWSWIARGQNHPLIVQPWQLSYSIHCHRMFPRNGRRLYRAPLTSSGRAFPRLAGDGEVRALTGRSRGSKARGVARPTIGVCV